MPGQRLPTFSAYTLVHVCVHGETARNSLVSSLPFPEHVPLYQRILHFCVTAESGLIFMQIFFRTWTRVRKARTAKNEKKKNEKNNDRNPHCCRTIVQLFADN